jgi:hypothetical protein
MDQGDLVSAAKITEVPSANFTATFSTEASYVIILTKTWLGYILSDVFANSFGHPDMDTDFIHMLTCVPVLCTTFVHRRLLSITKEDHRNLKTRERMKPWKVKK